ncbi:MAG: VWA domain-containing protein [Thiopseudomonas sp.]
MLSLAWPLVFLLLPLPVLLRYWLPPSTPAVSALRVPFYDQLTTLASHKRLRKHMRLVLPALIWLLVLLAAARPQWLELQRPLDMTARSSMLAFDLSASMLKEDLDTPGVSRFAATRQLVLQLLEQRPEDRFGLIFFASEAFLQSPLTFDHISLHHWLDTASPGIAGDNTAIGDAIGLGIKKLRQLPATERNLILLTDGANNSGIMPPRTAARFAAREGIRIHALGIGQPGDGNQDGPDLALLQEIAWLTGGRALHVTDNTLEPLLQLLDSLPANLSARSTLQAQELYSWPLLGALLLAMLQAACLLWQGNPAIRHKAEP